MKKAIMMVTEAVTGDPIKFMYFDCASMAPLLRHNGAIMEP
jgi:hypothetical protein